MDIIDKKVIVISAGKVTSIHEIGKCILVTVPEGVPTKVLDELALKINESYK